MTVPRPVVAVVRWTAVTGLALTAAETSHRVFSGPLADAPGYIAAAGIGLIGIASTPSTTRKARS
ncbi:hypothetical protein [Streptomyces sp. YIM S03343]